MLPYHNEKKKRPLTLAEKLAIVLIVILVIVILLLVFNRQILEYIKEFKEWYGNA